MKVGHLISVNDGEDIDKVQQEGQNREGLSGNDLLNIIFPRSQKGRYHC